MNKEEAKNDQQPHYIDNDADHVNSVAGGLSAGGQPERLCNWTAAAEDDNSNLWRESGMPNRDLLEFSKKLLEQDPSSELFVTLAEEFCSRKLWSEAVEICRRGLVFHPTHFRGRVLLGWALWELGEMGEAERLLTEARQEFEKNAIIYSILAAIAKKKGDSDQTWRLAHIYQSLVDSEGAQALEEREARDAPISESQEEDLEPIRAEQRTEEITEAPATEPQRVEEALEVLIAEPEQEEITESLDAQPLNKEPSAPFRFLSALQSKYEKYEERRIEAFSKPRIFSDADRMILNDIINTGTS